MKRTRMRALAVLLSLAMLLSLFPAVFAVEEEDSSPAEESQAAAVLQAEDASLEDAVDDIENVYVVFMTDGYNVDAGDSVSIDDALVLGAEGSMTYKWTSSDNSVATVSGSGQSATVSAKSEGTATITLTATRASDGDSDSDSVSIWVHDNRVTPVTAKGSPAGSLSLDAGGSQNLSVTASGGSGKYGYAWEDNDSAVAVDPDASGATCTVYGRYAGTGTITVTVYDQEDPSNYASISWSATVKETSTPLTQHISQNEMTLTPGEKATLTLYVEGGSGNESNYEYYWSSDNTSVASISGSGKTVTVTAASSINGATGSAEIRATAYDKVTKTTSETSYCGVIVRNSAASYNASGSATVGSSLPMQSIADAIASSFASQFGTTLSYSASVRISNPYSDTGVLEFGNGGQVESSGSCSFAIMQDMIFRPTNAGTFRTDYSITDNGKTISGTITISVSGGGPISDAALSPTSLRMETYSSQFLTLSVLPANASYTVTWSSSNSKIATVSGSGNTVTVYSQGNAGTTDIVASIRSGGGTLSRSIPVTVYNDNSAVYNPSLTLTLGSDYYGTGISDSIAKQWRNTFGGSLADNANITFGSVGNTRYGMLHLSNGAQIRANYGYNFSDFIGTYFEPYAAGTFSLPYIVSYRGNEMSGTMQINIRASSLNVTISPTSVSLAPYSSRNVNLSISPSSAYYRVSWSSSNTSVATVTGNGRSATINTAGKTGSATITATVVDGNGNNLYRSCSVQVSGSTSSAYNPSVTIPMGVYYTGTGNADSLTSQFRNVYNTNLNKNSATIRFSSMGDSKIGVLHMPNGTAAKANTNYTLAQFSDQMYVEPISAGTLRLPYTLTYNGMSLTGTASYVIASNNVSCSLTLKDSNPYLFSAALNNGAGGSQLSSTITNAVGSGWTYLRFGSWSGTVGTLYQNNNKAALSAGTNVTAQSLNQLYFVPAQSGTFSASFTVYNNSGKLADGTLTIVVPGASSFSDVASNAYYANAVSWALQKEVTTGTSATTFSPNDTVTRAQAVTFLWRAFGRPAVTNTVNPFTDVASDEYYTQAVLWAVQQGITNGTSATTFSPYATLAQDQMITFLCRAAGVGAFGDNWSDSAMSWAQGRGLFNGRPSVPKAKDSCPRADVVFYLWKNAN